MRIVIPTTWFGGKIKGKVRMGEKVLSIGSVSGKVIFKRDKRNMAPVKMYSRTNQRLFSDCLKAKVKEQRRPKPASKFWRKR